AHGRNRCGLGAAPAARYLHFRRPHREPAADALYDAGRLSGLRPLHQARASRGGAAGRRSASDMNLSAPFVRRPVATTLLTTGLMLAGVGAFFVLPVSPLPQVDFPVIAVRSTVPGDSQETVAWSVPTPSSTRRAVIASFNEMSSASTSGNSQITRLHDL